MTSQISLAPYLTDLDAISPFRWTGQVTEVVGLLVESQLQEIERGLADRLRKQS